MNEHTLTELIDQFLLGTISPGDKKYLEELIASDPLIADRMRTSQQAFAVIQHEQNRLLKEKLRAIDRESPKQSSLFPKWVLTLAICLIAILIYLVWVTRQFSPSAVAQRYFENRSMPEVGVLDRDALEETWHLANEAFTTGKYENAVLLFTTWIAEAGEVSTDEAQWNILLAELALHGPTQHWKTRFSAFVETASEPWKTQGQKISNLIRSGPYQMFFRGLKTNLSALKPRLI